ncbi:MAG: hypothetical protein JW893_04860 [Candidatus Omnitrophica bacterium]|nr:hypothetical protein [Candidatus Omnitrophota bacterium]
MGSFRDIGSCGHSFLCLDGIALVGDGDPQYDRGFHAGLSGMEPARPNLPKKYMEGYA